MIFFCFLRFFGFAGSSRPIDTIIADLKH
jgi:hypothetical protein